MRFQFNEKNTGNICLPYFFPLTVPQNLGQKKFFVETISKILKVYNIDVKTPWYKISKDVQNIILYGDKDSSENFISDFEGIINFIDRKYSETERWWVQYELENL